MKKINCMNFAGEKTHYSLHIFELKTKSMSLGGRGCLNALKYIIIAGTYIISIKIPDDCDRYSESI